MRHVNPPFICNHQGTWYTTFYLWDHPYTPPQKKRLLLQSTKANTHTKSLHNKIDRTFNISSSQTSQYHQQGQPVPSTKVRPCSNHNNQIPQTFIIKNLQQFNASVHTTNIGLCRFSLIMGQSFNVSICSINKSHKNIIHTPLLIAAQLNSPLETDTA